MFPIILAKLSNTITITKERVYASRSNVFKVYADCKNQPAGGSVSSEYERSSFKRCISFKKMSGAPKGTTKILYYITTKILSKGEKDFHCVYVH